MTVKKSIPVSVRILDKEYKVACPPEERDGLIRAADYVDEQMKKVRDVGKVTGLDRIAIITALNIAHEHLNKTAIAAPIDEDTEFLQTRIRFLQDKVNEALGKSGQLEL